MISWGSNETFTDDMQVVDIERVRVLCPDHYKHELEREIERIRVSKLWWTLAFIFGAFCWISMYVWITR